MLSDVPCWCCSQRRECCCCHHSNKQDHPVHRLVSLLVSSVVFTTCHLLLFLEVTLLRYGGHFALFQTPPMLPRCSVANSQWPQVWSHVSQVCICPRVRSEVWKENFLKLVRILPLQRRITRKWVLSLARVAKKISTTTSRVYFRFLFSRVSFIIVLCELFLWMHCFYALLFLKYMFF